MSRLLAAALALAALVAAGCGGDTSTTAVDGQTTPPPVAPTATTTAPATTTTPPPQIDAAAQFAKLQPCVGGKAAETYRWFEPTVEYARKLEGDGFTVTLKGKPVTLVVFPSAETAQLGYKDIQDRLIRLQQVRPTDYATVAATAAQAVGNVLEVATAGALDATSEAKVQSCITQSVT